MKNKLNAPEGFEWRHLGLVGVDAGCLMIADPCYVIGSDSEINKAHPGGWSQFCDEHFGEKDDPQVNYAKRHPGLGVVASTLHGDGCYSVYGLFAAGGRTPSRPHAMIVVTGDVAVQA